MSKKTMIEMSDNLEKMDQLATLFETTKKRIHDTNTSIHVKRTVKPTKGNFQAIKTTLNTLLNINMKKQRGDLKLIETMQEVYLVPENDEEKLKIKVLNTSLKWTMTNKELDQDAFDKLFSNKAWVQNYVTAGSQSIQCDNLNFINKFITSASLSNISEYDRYPRFNAIFENMPAEFPHYLRRIFRYKSTQYWFHTGVSQDVEKYEKIIELLKHFSDSEFDFGSIEEINEYPQQQFEEWVKSSIAVLDRINLQLDDYLNEISIPASEFFELLSDDTKNELDALVADRIKQETRAKNLVRNKVNVDLSFNLDVELKSLGTLDDIKNVIQDAVEKNLGMNVKMDFEPMSKDVKNISNVMFNGIELNSVTDQAA